MAKRSAGGKHVVPGVHKALDAMKYEIAEEMGLPVGLHRRSLNGNDSEFSSELGSMDGGGSSGSEDYWGHIASRDTGAVGGAMTHRLIRKAQEDLYQFFHIK